MPDRSGLRWTPRQWPDEPVIEFNADYRGCLIAVWYRQGEWHWLAEASTATVKSQTGNTRTREEAEHRAFEAADLLAKGIDLELRGGE